MKIAFDETLIKSLRKDYKELMRNIERVSDENDLRVFVAALKRWVVYVKTIVIGAADNRGESPFMVAATSGDIGSDGNYMSDSDVSNAKYFQQVMHTAWGELERYAATDWASNPWTSAKQGVPGVISQWSPTTKTYVRSYDLNTWEREKAKWKARTAVRARALWTAIERAASFLQRHQNMNTGTAATVDVIKKGGEAFELEGMTVVLEVSEFKDREAWRAGIKLFRERAQRVFPWIWKNRLPVHIADLGDAGGTYHKMAGPNSYINVNIHERPNPQRLAWVLTHEMGHHTFQHRLSGPTAAAWNAAVRADRTRLDLAQLLREWPPNIGDSAFALADWAKAAGHWTLYHHIQIMNWHWSPKARGTAAFPDAPIKGHWSTRAELETLIATNYTHANLPAHPITAYGEKNPEEAFCEALAGLVSRGPLRIHPLVQGLLRLVLGPELRIESVASTGARQLLEYAEGAMNVFEARAILEADIGAELAGRMAALLAAYTPAGAKETADWIAANFNIGMTRTPGGTKDIKKTASMLMWALRHDGTWNRTDYAKNVERDWSDLLPNLDTFTKSYAIQSATAAPVELVIGSNRYINSKGLPKKSLEQLAQRLEAIFASLTGWRKGALVGGVVVNMAGAEKFRGTAGGKYASQEGVMYVRATPAVVKRTGSAYGGFEYILVHELGHRFEYKSRNRMPPIDFDHQEWRTSPYSMKDGEGFAELFALGHFGITAVHGYEFATTLERFEKAMR